MHDTVTTDSATIHITFGLHPSYWFDLIHEVSLLAQDMPEFRRSIPNPLCDPHAQARFKEAFLLQCSELFENIDVEQLVERRFDQFSDGRRSDDRHRFRDLTQLNKLNLNSVVRRREHVLFKLVHEGKEVAVRFHGKSVKFPRFLEASLGPALHEGSFAIKDIGGLIADSGKIELIQKLISEGLLEIQELGAD